MDFAKFKPLRGIVLVCRDPKKSNDGGIVIPEALQQYGWRATIVAVGEDADHYKPGDEILFLKEYTVLPFPEREIATTEARHILAKIITENFIERIMPENRFAIVQEDNPVDHDGLVIPSCKLHKNTQAGTVLRVSPKCYDLKPGMCIIYDRSVANCIEDDKFYRIVDEKDVLCVRED